ncbi:glucosaminidase domain-containing protein [Merdimonas faecis]|uniref:N-acetylmuramoyl-L-alanine amidase n=1 Tax=Merdimonas faecis TaxID=1653435 RepID=A0A9D3AJQ3_9FIRM|nr:N-acetylmuramoyl-L-alanine amidase [Merdimonas faecis]HJH50073.1 N-acetylmuramoyl-L-alanine amidase [Merdimonas faecis]
MRINVHAGHNPDGMVACGAIGLIRESTEARAVKDRVIAQLAAMGHSVRDCTCNNGTDQNDVLKKIVAVCNAQEADLDISIHFNTDADPEIQDPDGVTTGTEVLVYSNSSAAAPYAQQVVDSIAALGFRNRGVKERQKLYVLRHTQAPAMLIECCFVDDPEDVALYNADRMAAAIVAGITGQAAETTADAAKLAAMSQAEFVDWIGQLAAADMQTSGILASVTVAQSILESGYGKSELALNALNLGGMKAELSGNTWPSRWDGKIYKKDTAEQEPDGTYITIKADFRAYPSVAAYLADHSAYLAGAKKGDSLRYAGIVGCTDYRTAFQILKDGEYATSLDYVDKLCAVVEKWNLTRYDGATPVGQSEIYWLSAADVFTEAEADAVKVQLEQAWPGLNLLKRRGIVTKAY